MHTIAIKSTCITETTGTLPTRDSVNCDPHQLMCKVGYSIEKLDIILLQVINCKSRLDEIFRHLSDCGEQNVSVSISVGSKIARVEQSITNSPITTYLDSLHDKINGVVFPPM